MTSEGTGMSITGEFIQIASETIAIGTGEIVGMIAVIAEMTAGIAVTTVVMTAETGRGDSKRSRKETPVMFSMTGISSVLIR